jgi:hypothetical protein
MPVQAVFKLYIIYLFILLKFGFNIHIGVSVRVHVRVYGGPNSSSHNLGGFCKDNFQQKL